MSQPPATPEYRSFARSVASRLGPLLAFIAGGPGIGLAQETPAGRPDVPPHPVAVWPSGPLDVIAALDRPVSPEAARSMVGLTITYDEEASRGRPPSPTASGPIGRLQIVGARLEDDGRTLVLATDPHPRPARYLLPWPDDRRQPASKGLPISTIPYDLSGAEAVWSEGEDPGAGPRWSGWWPSLDLDVTRRATRGSRRHEAGWALLERTGRLVLSTWVRLPPGKVVFRLQSTRPIEDAMLGDAQAAGRGPESDGFFRSELAVESRGEPLFLTSTLRTGGPGKPLLTRASFRMAGESTDRSIDQVILQLPWAPPSTAVATAAPLAIPDLSGGDRDRGRAIFRGDQARCAHCHTFRGEGGRIGPDLTEIARKGRAEIYRNIAAPSAVIEPDYTTYTVATRDGQVFSGVVRAEGPDQIKVTDTNARSTSVRRDQLQEIRPSATSIMPPGLAAALGDSAVRDLIAYLTSTAPPAHLSPR